MKAIYGVGNVSPLILESYLSKYEKEKKTRLKKQVILSNKDKIKSGVDVVFSSNLLSVSRNLTALNESEAVIFVFDSPLLLSSVGICVIDGLVSKDRTKYKFIDFTWHAFSSRLTEGLVLDGNKSINIDASKFYPSLFLSAREESITQVLLALTLTSDENRKKITTTLAKWLLGKEKSVKKLKDSMVMYIEPGTFKILERFLSTNVGLNTLWVFSRVKSGMSDEEIKKLCKVKKVPSFDVLYILSQLPMNEVSKNASYNY